jgi:hypothetical protein
MADIASAIPDVIWSPAAAAADRANCAVAAEPSRSASHMRAMLAQPSPLARIAPVSSGDSLARCSSLNPSRGRPAPSSTVQGFSQDRDLRRAPADAERRRRGGHEPDATAHIAKE